LPQHLERGKVRGQWFLVPAPKARRYVHDDDGGESMDLLAILHKLYDAQIDVSIESAWDNGYTVAIGKERQGLDTDEHFTVDDLDDLPEWLERKARGLHPGAFG